MEKRCPRREINILEALLFASGDPVALKDMSKVLGLPESTCKGLVLTLQKRYEKENAGTTVLQLEERFQMTTNPVYFPNIELLYQQQSKVHLTEVQLETLAIIVYKQPVTRQEISDIRGVESSAVVQRLMQMELVEEAGRLKAPGRPVLLKTTDAFLKAFQLSSVKDLPHLVEPAHTPEEVAPTEVKTSQVSLTEIEEPDRVDLSLGENPDIEG